MQACTCSIIHIGSCCRPLRLCLQIFFFFSSFLEESKSRCNDALRTSREGAAPMTHLISASLLPSRTSPTPQLSFSFLLSPFSFLLSPFSLLPSPFSPSPYNYATTTYSTFSESSDISSQPHPGQNINTLTPRRLRLDSEGNA